MEKTIELIPGLPEEIALECLTRLPYTAHRVASRVCRRWGDLLQSVDFYNHRRNLGHTHNVACLVQALTGHGSSEKSGNSPSYGIAVFDPASQTWDRLAPVPEYENGLPLFCQLAGIDGKLVVMGGWDPASYEPITNVFVYDFVTRRWRRGKVMPSRRSFFAAGSSGGRVYVAGGHDENKNALRTGWVYDPRQDEWAELTQLSQERDECEGVAFGNEFWVVSGYGTDYQGVFAGNAEVYEIGPGRWKRVEGVWKPGRCPRSCVGLGKDGKLVCWADMGPEVRVGVCGIMLGSWALVTGCEYEGGPQGFYMVEGQNGKLERIDVPNEFSGFVQSGCSVHI